MVVRELRGSKKATTSGLFGLYRDTENSAWTFSAATGFMDDGVAANVTAKIYKSPGYDSDVLKAGSLRLWRPTVFSSPVFWG